MSHTSCTVESAWLLWCQACCNICFLPSAPIESDSKLYGKGAQDSAVLSPLTCNALLQSPNGCCCFGKDQHLTMFAGFSLQAELLAFVSIAYQQTTCTGMACSCCTPTAIDAVLLDANTMPALRPAAGSALLHLLNEPVLSPHDCVHTLLTARLSCRLL